MTFANFIFITVSALTLSAVVFADAPTEKEVLDEIQIGPAWNRFVFDSQLASTLPPGLRQASLAIANFRGGTAFYVGKVDGKFVMATNAHVVAQRSDDLLPEKIDHLRGNPASICTTGSDKETIRFGVQDKTFECGQLVGVWPEIELALFTIEVEKADEQMFDGLGVSFDFTNVPRLGMPIKTMGYGQFLNPGASEISLMEAGGPACKIYSATGSFKYLADPDKHSPGPYQVWSLALGCNVAWGDSGAPVIDVLNGRVIGLIWTGGFPKIKNVQNLDFLTKIANEQAPEIWTELNYASPAVKIGGLLREQLRNGSNSRFLKDVIAYLLLKGM